MYKYFAAGDEQEHGHEHCGSGVLGLVGLVVVLVMGGRYVGGNVTGFFVVIVRSVGGR